jgi:hypothetical protein
MFGDANGSRCSLAPFFAGLSGEHLMNPTGATLTEKLATLWTLPHTGVNVCAAVHARLSSCVRRIH